MKLRKTIRRLFKGTYLLPSIVKNPHGGLKLVRRGKVRGRKIISKLYAPKDIGERFRRQEVIQNLDKFQGQRYVLKVSRRYPSKKSVRIEDWYDQPTLADVKKIHDGKVTKKLRLFCDSKGIPPHKLLELCSRAELELDNKQREIGVWFDNSPGNLSVDVEKSGKIIFRVFDF